MKFNDIIKKAGDNYSLSHEERSRMDRVVRQYMKFKPLPRGEEYSILVSYRWLTFAHRPIAAALCLVLIFGTGISYAAASALPGDALYAVKTYVNEPVRVALATSAEAKANVQIELAERRIDEAATLAAEGRLDSQTQQDLTVAFESHAAAASENIEKADDADSGVATELASRFETRLAAHDEILSEVSDESGTTTESLAQAIRGAGKAVAEIRARAEEKAEVSSNAAAHIAAPVVATLSEMKATALEATDTAQALMTESRVSRAAAERMQKAAHRQFDNVKKKAANASLNDDMRANIDTRLFEADKLLQIGEAQLTNGETALAFHSLQDSLVISEKIAVLLKSAAILAKAQSRKSHSDRIDIRTGQNAANTRAAATMQTAATEVTAPVPVKVEIHADSAADVKVQNILPPTIQIFPKHDDKDEDGHEDDRTDSGKLQINPSL